MSTVIRKINETGTTAEYISHQDFSVNKTDGDGSKSGAVSHRMGKIFSNNKGKFAVFAVASLLTLPALPFTWLVAYTLVRRSAKNDVANAIAEKRVEFLKSHEESGEDIEEGIHTPLSGSDSNEESGSLDLSNSPNSSREISSDSDEGSSGEDSFGEGKEPIEPSITADKIRERLLENKKFNRYFKKSHASMVINSEISELARNLPTAKKQWEAYKNEYQTIVQLRNKFKEKFKISDTDLDDYVKAVLLAQYLDDPEQVVYELANTQKIIRILSQGIALNTNDFKFQFENRKAQTKENFQSMESAIKAKVIEDMKRNSSEAPLLTITKHELPLYALTLRDAKQGLPAILIKDMSGDYEAHKATVSYTDMCNTSGTIMENSGDDSMILNNIARQLVRDSKDALIIHDTHGKDNVKTLLSDKAVSGDTYRRTQVEHILSNNVLTPIISLYNQIIDSNQKMSEENRKELWKILQFSSGQTGRSGIQQTLINDILEKGAFFSKSRDSGQGEEKQDSYIEYHYDMHNNNLIITYNERLFFQDSTYFKSIDQVLHASVMMTVKLDAETIEPEYKILEFTSIPSSQQGEEGEFFDHLPSRKTISTPEDLIDFFRPQQEAE